MEFFLSVTEQNWRARAFLSPGESEFVMLTAMVSCRLGVKDAGREAKR
jgi:hypothetical protein